VGVLEAAMTASRFTSEQQRTLLDVAASSIGAVLAAWQREEVDVAAYDPALHEPGATFVTLERGGALLGCVGTLEPVRPLVADVAHNAAAAAFADPRLPPVTRDDYVVMSIEISVLGRLEPIQASDVAGLTALLRPGVDGVVVDAPSARATFLPAVWRHFGADPDAFVGALWRKARLRPGTWPRGTRCSRYGAAKLVEPGPRTPVGG
jgi:AmmeMemoRadiSam system protein A